MNKIEFPLLRADQIEAKVKKVTEKGANILLYKTARVDMDMLDEVIGPANWQNDYREVKENMYCGIAVNCDGEWVWKWDCGTESRADGEGNEKKGEASDAFKRAGFRWGIGRELYTSPFIFIKAENVEIVPNGGGYKLKNPFERFKVAEINYDENRRVSGLVIVNSRGIEVFKWGNVTYSAPKEPKKAAQKKTQETAPQETAPQPEAELIQCEECGGFIAGTTTKAGFYSAQRLAQMSLDKYGHIYCTKCAMKMKRGEIA